MKECSDCGCETEHLVLRGESSLAGGEYYSSSLSSQGICTNCAQKRREDAIIEHESLEPTPSKGMED